MTRFVFRGPQRRCEKNQEEMCADGGAEAGFLRTIGPFLAQAPNCQTLKDHPRSARERQTPVVEGKAEANFIRITEEWGWRDGSEARACVALLEDPHGMS